MTRLRVAIVMLALGWLLPAHDASAQGFDKLYAQGVHAYFNGSSHDADRLLSQALTLNHRDPRAYYFRGLARLRTGRGYEAEQDFQVGAAMEAAWAGRPIAMGRTLQRIQGGDRLKLERIRKEARETRDTITTDNLAQRYQRTIDRGSEVVRTEFRLPLSSLTAEQSPDDLAKMVAAQATAGGDPFADDPVERAATPIEIPEPARGALKASELGGVFGRMLGRVFPGSGPAGAMADDPFGADKGMSDAAGEDSFGAPTDDPADDPFGSDNAGPTGDDPFGGADEDPFGSDSDPFGDDSGGGNAGDDPFGDDPFGS